MIFKHPFQFFTAKLHSIIEAEFSYFETFRLENR